MDYNIKDVSDRLKATRECLDITVEQMAADTSVSVEEYISLENGEKDFSLSFLNEAAEALGIELIELLTGVTPKLKTYSVVRKDKGLPIERRRRFAYQHLAYLFKNKHIEPLLVTAPYEKEEQDKPIYLSSHDGQEMDFILSGSLKIQIGKHVEILNEGDCIYYDSSTPHNEIALGGEDCEIYAIVMNPEEGGVAEYKEKVKTFTTTNVDLAKLKAPVYEKFVETTVDDKGVVNSVKFKNDDTFNFAYDVVDELARKAPSKTAMIHVTNDKKTRRFTFADLSRYSAQTANYFADMGIKKGDRVMLVLKRHYQFWFSILALHKLGAIVIPATNQLKDHDFEYRFNAAGVSAIVCTGDGDVAEEVDKSLAKSPTVKTKIICGRSKEGWNNFDEDLVKYDTVFERPADAACGTDTMLMLFTSGTTGYPRIAAHNHKYPLGHFLTAKYWHNVDPNGLHFTISDTGWGKALWGKLYGQWLCEAATFVYDFDRFDAHDILPMFAEYKITTFCAPTTMYRFFIKEDLKNYDLSSIKYATVAGEAMNPEVYNQFLKATGIRIMEGFGQTETTLTIANFVGETNKIGSMGKPSPLYDVDIQLADGKPAGVGEVGEIVIRTEEAVPNGLYEGYYLDEEKTKEAWHDGYYHTGDTAWKDEDGYFWYVGRVDDLIKSSGYRIGPFEIESVIMELPYVLECAVVAAPDEIRGQVVKANIVLTKGTQPSDELKKEIQVYVKNRTAPYKYPRIVEFMEELPKTISGKVRRVELRK